VTREDFDAIIGHCAGISDLPGATFARELIAAYPEAKVILNTRSDMAAWYASFESTIGTFDKDPKDWGWCKSWFWYVNICGLKRNRLFAADDRYIVSAELFWARQYMSRSQLPGFFGGSFASNGVWKHQEHIAMVRGLGLPRERLLEWQAADGWAPLCASRFLPTFLFPKAILPQSGCSESGRPCRSTTKERCGKWLYSGHWSSPSFPGWRM